MFHNIQKQLIFTLWLYKPELNIDHNPHQQSLLLSKRSEFWQSLVGSDQVSISPDLDPQGKGVWGPGVVGEFPKYISFHV